MIEKLKALGESAKNVVFYLITPLVIIAVVIYHLVTKVDTLEDELRVKDEKGNLDGLQGQQKQIDASSSDAVDSYEKLRDAYLRSGSEPVRQSGAGTEEADRGKGPGAGGDPANPKG